MKSNIVNRRYFAACYTSCKCMLMSWGRFWGTPIGGLFAIMGSITLFESVLSSALPSSLQATIFGLSGWVVIRGAVPHMLDFLRAWATGQPTVSGRLAARIVDIFSLPRTLIMLLVVGWFSDGLLLLLCAGTLYHMDWRWLPAAFLPWYWQRLIAVCLKTLLRARRF